MAITLIQMKTYRDYFKRVGRGDVMFFQGIPLYNLYIKDSLDGDQDFLT